jgi:hypothetical protein
MQSYLPNRIRRTPRFAMFGVNIGRGHLLRCPGLVGHIRRDLIQSNPPGARSAIVGPSSTYGRICETVHRSITRYSHIFWVARFRNVGSTGNHSGQALQLINAPEDLSGDFRPATSFVSNEGGSFHPCTQESSWDDGSDTRHRCKQHKCLVRRPGKFLLIASVAVLMFSRRRDTSVKVKRKSPTKHAVKLALDEGRRERWPVLARPRPFQLYPLGRVQSRQIAEQARNLCLDKPAVH